MGITQSEREKTDFDMSEEDYISLITKHWLSEVNTMLPAIIKSYDHSTNKASVEVTISKVNASGDIYSLPILNEVPVSVFRSGGFNITIPVKAGDECYLIFSQRDMGIWKIDGSQKLPPQSNEMFSLSDAICIVGLQSDKNPLSDIQTDALELRTEDRSVIVSVKQDEASVIVGSTSIIIAKDGSVEINTTGGVNVVGDVTADGISLKGHTHNAGVTLLDSVGGPVTGTTGDPVAIP